MRVCVCVCVCVWGGGGSKILAVGFNIAGMCPLLLATKRLESHLNGTNSQASGLSAVVVYTKYDISLHKSNR